jgi:uncharacterized membrane protein
MPIFYRYGLFFLLAFFFVLMGQITLRYLPIRTDVAFLLIKQEYISITPWLIAFFIHVFTSILALAAGFTQFSGGVLRRYRTIHRTVGKCYVVVILFVSGPASFVMALLANGGIPARIAFTSLSLLWMYSTAKAWQTAKAGKFALHRNWMYRSYSLTLSAVTLRSWKWLLIALFHLRPLDVYIIVSWLGFVPNLLVAEWIIQKRLSWLPLTGKPGDVKTGGETLS